ncbi:MAG: hypothetical protein RLZZ436_2675, partial [Planctomycetota bacterium]
MSTQTFRGGIRQAGQSIEVQRPLVLTQTLHRCVGQACQTTQKQVTSMLAQTFRGG